ncbi:PKD domain-containing protein [Fulvivirga sp. M361]|uniref:PKD domain-containing protein n=1 Tax=Fulvivirga sp. M361 TaxID=2594266 RepID=UPI00162A9BBC|nr:PKD domain-containing protein [Fulvivirga sp. M361]
MKTIILYLVSFITFHIVTAQEGGQVMVGNASQAGVIAVKEGFFNIDGNLEITQGILDGNGTITLDQDLVNQSPGDLTNKGSVTLFLNGDKAQFIRPVTHPIRFRKVIVKNGTDSVRIVKGQFHVFDSLVFETGNLFLDTATLVLDSEAPPAAPILMGSIINERVKSRIIPTRRDSIVFDHFLTGTELNNLNPGNLGITMTATTSLTSIVRKHTPSDLENSSISRSYQLFNASPASGTYDLALHYFENIESSFFPKKSVQFTGSSDKIIRLPEVASGILANSYTIEVRLRSEDLSGRSFLVLKDNVFLMGIAAGTNTPELVHIDENKRHFITGTSYDLGDGLSHLLTARYDAVLRELSLFIDGVLVAKETEVSPAKYINDDRIRLGQQYRGNLSEARFWSTALEDHTIRANALKFLSGSEPGLFAYYDFEGDETVLEDKGGDLDGEFFDGLQNNWITDTTAVPSSLLTAWQKNDSPAYVNRGGEYSGDPSRIRTTGEGDVLGKWTASYCTPPPLTISDYTICNGNTVRLTVEETNYTSYTWYIGDSLVRKGTDPFYEFIPKNDLTRVNVRVIDDKNCDNSAVSTIKFFDDPELLISELSGSDTLAIANKTTSFCPGSASMLFGGDWSSYRWTYHSFDFIPAVEGLGTQANVLADKAGNYVLTVANIHGCETTDTVVVFERARPAFTLQDSKICQGDSALFSTSLSSADFNFKWELQGQIVSTKSEFYALNEGNYTLTVTNALSCTTIDTAELTFFEPAKLDLVRDSVAFCRGTAALLEVANPIAGYTYEWYDGANNFLQNSAQVVISNAGIYHVQATSSFNLGGCTTSKEIATYALNLPSFELPDTVAFCGQTTISIKNDFDQYTWLNQKNRFVASTTNILTTGTHGIYEVTAINSLGCSSTQEILLIPDPVLGCVANDSVSICTASADFPIQDQYIKCSEEVLSFTLDPSFQNVTWFDTNYRVLSTGNNWNLTNAGRYSVSVTTDSCAILKDFEISFFDQPVSNLTSFISSCDQEVVLGEGLRELNPGATIRWQEEASGDLLTVTESGTYTVRIETEDKCIQTFETEVALRTTDLIQLPEAININCEGITLDPGNLGFSYTWSDGSNNQNLFVDNSGIYSVEVVSEFGCVDFREVNVILNPPTDSAFFLGVLEAFVSDTIFFIGLPTSEPNWYSWDFGDGNGSDEIIPAHIYTDSGRYEIRLTTEFENGCIDEYAYPIDILPLPFNPKGGRPGTLVVENILEFSVSPNPTESKLLAKVVFNEKTSGVLELISGHNSVIDVRSLENNTDFVEMFDLTPMASGVYILRLIIEDESRSLRVVKL